MFSSLGALRPQDTDRQNPPDANVQNQRLQARSSAVVKKSFLHGLTAPDIFLHYGELLNVVL